jgi:hypothetical protein
MCWRNKLLVVLVVYFAGFATAIYCLAPVRIQAAGQTEPNQQKSFLQTSTNSNDFTQSFNSGMRKCLAVGSDAAVQAGEYLKQKFSNKETPKNIARR